jgi:hypothetical protein
LSEFTENTIPPSNIQGDQVTIQTYLLLFAIAILKLLDLGRAGLVSWAGLQMTLGTKRRRTTDVSALMIPPPPITQRSIDLLQRAGFQRLGEAQIKLPMRSVSTTWVLVDADHHVQAETLAGRVSFSSFFRDDVLVVTDYPNGEHINTPTYQSHTITADLNSAYRYHLEQVEKFSRKYGVPNSILNMADYHRGETMGRVYPYARLKLRRFIWVEIVRLVAFVVGLFALLLELLLLLKPSIFPMYFKFPMEVFGNISMIITLLVLFAPDIFQLWMINQTYKDSAER